ncbi:MAG: hypothetical protein EBQ96_04000 [Proteobacteria bacterium]|nr:hypothetical protein [Pseudomonadota bacterium]
MSEQTTVIDSEDSGSSRRSTAHGGTYDWQRERRARQDTSSGIGDYFGGFNRQAADHAMYRTANADQLLGMLRTAVSDQWQLMLDVSPHVNPSFARIEAMLIELAARIKDPQAVSALAFVTAKEVNPDNPNRSRYINYAPRGLPAIKHVCAAFDFPVPAGMEAKILADIERRAAALKGDRGGKASAPEPTTEQGRLEAKLVSELATIWNPMVLATPELRVGLNEIEATLAKLAGLKDDRAVQALAFINETTPESAYTGRPVLKNYAPRGLPAVREVYRLFGLEEPKDRVDAVVAAVRKSQAANGANHRRYAAA